MRRVSFEVDFDFVGANYLLRKRTNRSINHSRISWIHSHGAELEREKDKTKHWLCRLRYDSGKCKLLTAVSTGSCGEHLDGSHGIYATMSAHTMCPDSVVRT
jgi:hypothetical protein